MLERLINEDREGAEELFHEIVVERSREIYEGLLENDLEIDETEDEEVDEATDEEVDESDDDEEVEESKSNKSATEQMREYVEKVAGGELGSKIGGDDGANKKSPVASKNDMGGTASNIAQGKDNEAGDHAGLGDMNAKEDSAGNVNVPGGKAGKSMKAEPKGHGAEKKGAAPEKAGAESPINGVSTRAK